MKLSSVISSRVSSSVTWLYFERRYTPFQMLTSRSRRKRAAVGGGGIAL